jgi:predicted AlkP superfamily pyrophosphatase or phosphodiesterase
LSSKARVGLLAAALAWLASASSGTALGAEGARIEDTSAPSTVILLAWDGVRHDYPDRAELPGLARMERDGVRASRITPPFPSSTFPSMVTIATGTYPDRHGIVDNTFRDANRGPFDREADPSWIEAEPLWIAAERQGVRSAVFFWVGSEQDWRGQGARFRKAPFDGEVGEEEKVAQILAWLDLPPAERPRLIMAWWHGTDRVGHQKGPDHPDVAAALVQQDRQLERLLAGIDERGAWGSTTVVVVSDHGMTAVRESVAVAERLAAAGIEAEVIAGGAVAHVFLDEPSSADAAVRALEGLEGVAVHRRADVPAALRLAHPHRTGDLVLTVAPPRTFVAPGIAERAVSLASGLLGWERGMHGFDPALSDMGGIFFAVGNGVPRGERIDPVRAIDVAPTVAAILGIEPPLDAEGEPLPFARGSACAE